MCGPFCGPINALMTHVNVALPEHTEQKEGGNENGKQKVMSAISEYFPLSAALIAEVWNLPSRAKQYRLASLCVLATYLSKHCLPLYYSAIWADGLHISETFSMWRISGCCVVCALPCSIYLSMGNYMVNILRPLYMLG